MLSNFFLKKKLKHDNKDVRLEALTEVTDSDLIFECAETDSLPEIRKAAILKIEDPQLLEKLAAKEQDSELSGLLNEKIDKIYTGIVVASASPEECGSLLKKIKNEDYLATIACSVGSIPIARSAARNIKSPHQLIKILNNRDNSELGLELLERLRGNQEALEQLADSAKSEKVRIAVKTRLVVNNRKAGEKIDKAVEAVDGGISNEVKTLLREREACCVKVENLQARVDPSTSMEFEGLKQQWSDLPPAPQAYQEILDKRFDNACQKFHEGVARAEEKVRTRYQKVDQLEELCLQAARMSKETALLPKKREIHHMKEDWKKISADVDDIDAYQKKFDNTCSMLEERIAAEEKNQNDALDIATRVCDDLEKLLNGPDAGLSKELKIALDAEIANAFALINPENHKVKELDIKYKRLCRAYSGKIHQLYQTRDLERWANYTLKLGLCKELEKMIDLEDKDLPAAAKRLKELRLHWKNIGSVPHEKADEIWKQFHETSEKLQTRINAYYEHLNASREEAANIKRAICEEAEAAAASSEWGATAETLKTLQQKWKDTGIAHQELERELYQRFRETCDVFFNARKQYYKESKDYRDSIIALKQELCDEAGRLNELPYGEAHRRVPMLWERWKAAGSAGRDDQRLYDSFRGAFDKYYAELRDQRIANLEQEKKICQDLSVLAGELEQDSVSAEDIRTRFRAIVREWENCGQGPRDDEQPIIEQYEKLCGQIDQHLKQ
ncbi:MAG: DUF349 domain-containing protein, partial [Victivallaceae bacterium]